MILPKLNSRCAFLWTLLSTTVLALLPQPGWFDGPVASSSASSDVPGGSSTDTDDHSGLDGDSFVQRWLLLAPIPFAANESASDAFYREQIKDEARLTPKAGEKVKFG